MDFPGGLGEQAVKDVVGKYPAIGAILERYEIGCVSCGVGICLLKDVVSIHGLPSETEQEIQREIGACLEEPHSGGKET